MNKILITIIIIGLGGSTFGVPEILRAAAPKGQQISEAQIKKLSPALQEVLQKIRTGKIEDLPPFPDLKTFLDTSEAQIKSLQAQLNTLLAEKGYLIGTEFDQFAQKALVESKAHISTLRGVQDLLGPNQGSIAYDRAQLPLYIQFLQNVPPPDTFPGQCYNYDMQGGREVTGIVQRFLGRLIFQYGAGENEFYNFIDHISDVGLIHSGKEYIVSITPNGMQQKAWVGPDNKVACLSLTYKVSTPINPIGNKPLPNPKPSKRPGAPANQR